MRSNTVKMITLYLDRVIERLEKETKTSYKTIIMVSLAVKLFHRCVMFLNEE